MDMEKIASGGKVSKKTTQKPFDIHCDVISLTYKHVGLDKDDIMSRVNNYLNSGDLFGAAVAEEHYANGLKHFHVWIKTKQPRYWTMKTLDYLGGTHGFYTAVRSTPYKNLAYVLKDNNFVITSANDFKTVCCKAVDAYGFKYATLDACIKRPQKISDDVEPKGANFKIKKGKDGIFAGVQKPATQSVLSNYFK